MSDLISRQDVLALAKDVTLQNGCKHRCIDASMIHELPSAESEIIRCKDCKHYRTFEDGISVSWCDLGHSREIDIYDEWFCADAKPKEGEKE